jgi:hypothetical protein
MEELGALRHPAAHGLLGDLDAVPPKHLGLPVQRQVFGQLAHDHLRQKRCTRGALLDGLRRLAGRPHGARAGVGEAGILNHLHLRRKIFVALADLFADLAQILITIGAAFFLFR